MSKPVWLKLFDDSELEATVKLLSDPGQFSKHAASLRLLLQKYIEDHRLKVITAWSWREVEFTEAMKLLTCLGNMSWRIQHPEQCNYEAFEPELIKLFESFWAEGWPYLQPAQDPGARKRAQQRHDAAKKDRAGKLPDTARLQTEYDEIAAKSGERGAAGILARKFEVTASAVRKALKKQKSGT